MHHLRNHLENLQLELEELEERRTELKAEIELILWELRDDEQQTQVVEDPMETQVVEDPMETQVVEEPVETELVEPDVPTVVIAATAEEFYLNGDIGKNEEDQYCIIPLLPNCFKCDRRFWGILLGRTSDNNLWVMHLEAWIRWSLVVHKNLLETDTNRTLTRYAVMPTFFHEKFLDLDWDRCVKISNGSARPYFSWLAVDTVLIPISCIDSTWFMLEFQIPTNELTVYSRELKGIPREFMTYLTTFYKQNIRQFYNQVKHGHHQVLAREPTLYIKPLKQYRGSKQHAGVFVCMFIHFLLHNEKEEVVVGDISKGEVTEFRKMMADIFYAKRR